MTAKRAANPKKNGESRSPFTTLQFTARVPRNEGPAALISQGEFAEMMGVTGETVRGWRARGLPVVGSTARPLYPLPDCFAWGLTFQILTTPGSRFARKVRFLSLTEAVAFHLDRQREEVVENFGGPPEYVLVPLLWSHPHRKRQLEIAARGLRPDPIDDEGELEEDDDD